MAFIEPTAPSPADTTRSSVTDERTRVLGRRVVNFIIDTVVVAVPIWAVFFAVADSFPSGFDNGGNGIYVTISTGDTTHQLHGGGAVLFLLAGLLAWIGYQWLMVAAAGATVGMLITGLRVVDEDGGRPAAAPALLRAVMWVVDDAPWILPGLVAFVAAASSPRRQRVGDRAAKTLVVRR
jgi:uncharacterized RDD family membrane protein YckC